MTRRLSPIEFLDALDELVVEGILAMSGDELRAEILAEGGDPDAMAAEARACLDRVISLVRWCDSRAVQAENC